MHQSPLYSLASRISAGVLDGRAIIEEDACVGGVDSGLERGGRGSATRFKLIENEDPFVAGCLEIDLNRRRGVEEAFAERASCGRE